MPGRQSAGNSMSTTGPMTRATRPTAVPSAAGVLSAGAFLAVVFFAGAFLAVVFFAGAFFAGVFDAGAFGAVFAVGVMGCSLPVRRRRARPRPTQSR